MLSQRLNVKVWRGKDCSVPDTLQVRRRRCCARVRCDNDLADPSNPGQPLSVFCERTPAPKSKHCKQCKATAGATAHPDDADKGSSSSSGEEDGDEEPEGGDMQGVRLRSQG